jgi:hypothetical protein
MYDVDLKSDPFAAMGQVAVKSKNPAAIESASKNLKEYASYATGTSDVQKWIEEHRMIYGKKFSYEDAGVLMELGDKDKKLDKAPRPYLTQYVADKTKDKSTIKCRQSEFTENEVNENIWLSATIPHFNVRHIFPTSGLALQISKEKIHPAIMNSPKLKPLIQRPVNITSKHFINESFYTVDGSWTDHGGRGPSSDKITFDEYETQNPQIEEIYSESLSHSQWQIKTRISTPMFPNSGIDEMYNKGCMYEWVITCPKCKKRQAMEFPDNLMNFFDVSNESTTSEKYIRKLNKIYIGCKFCGAYLDKVSRHYINTSFWEARRPHLKKTRASYRVTYMMLPWKTGKEITMKYHSFKFVHQFWNEIMGYAFVDPTAQLTRDLFERCIDTSFRNSFRKVVMARNVSVGVDWGGTSWCVVRANGFPPRKKLSRVIYVERIDEESLKRNGYSGAATDHQKRVAEIFAYFGGKILINDANGIGVDKNSYLIKKFPTRAWGCFYDTDEIQKQKKRTKLIEPRFSQGNRTVTVSRVSTFKMMLQEYEEEKVRIPQLNPAVNEFIDHHVNIAVQIMADEKTGQLYEVVGKTGEDHYAHADNYSKIGFDFLVNTYRGSSVGVVTAKKRNKKEIIETYVHPDFQ